MITLNKNKLKKELNSMSGLGLWKEVLSHISNQHQPDALHTICESIWNNLVGENVAGGIISQFYDNIVQK